MSRVRVNLEVLADPREFVNDGYTESAQVLLGADSGQHQQLR